ncbi:predicted protein [Naegleria gruberi]|uniref:Predicted protein n=1 Tax=Naegleria gruberi TaxID=5762 RepID=D2VJE7_NAEGR|nr:uncharacterized protein NAEGRDRAFT_69012 [Naegleria gruberi]EFC43028.1 predicted protein [Naegleria gruberi]|eukprot:XP_002675772.1 predicted protein [Naegleria gruberi strain NEG-M]
MSAPTIEQVLLKLKTHLSLTEEEQAKECPFTADEKKVFIENHGQIVSGCPAFSNHGCPFTQIHTLKTLKEKVGHIQGLENRCPAMANSSSTHDVIAQLLKD